MSKMNEKGMVFANEEQKMAVLQKMEKRMQRSKLGFLISGVSSIFGIISWVCMFKMNATLYGISFLVAVIGAVVSYVVTGGVGHAIKCAAKIGKWGWIIMPFPMDILTGLCSMFIALTGFMTVPFIFVAMGYKETKEKYEMLCVYGSDLYRE